MGRGALFTKPNTFNTGQTSDPAAVNSNFDTILNNLDPSGIGSYFATTTEMQATSNPAPGGTPSIPTSLLVWMEQIQYQLVQITGNSYWYQAANNLSGITLTTPVMASFYQDAGKTKLITVPAVASDTLAVLGAAQTFSGHITFSGTGANAPSTTDFTNMNHDHSVANKGGQIGSSGITAALGTWSTAGTADGISRQAATDLMVFAQVTSNINLTMDLKGYTDSANPPTTGIFEVNEAVGGVAVIRSACMVVKKGHYWKVTNSNCASTQVYTIPLGS